MKLQIIQWAGVLIEDLDTKMMIDPVTQVDVTFFGEPKEPFISLNMFKDIDLIALTHLHSDHFDALSIKEAFGDKILILVPHPCVQNIKDKGFTNVRGLTVHESFKYKNLLITPSFSVDGLGDVQVSWIVEGENGKRIIHCGDTLWHGYWWKMAERFGSFHAAFLPINSPIIKEDGLTESNQPICMNPEQATAAAKILKAERLIPIHYGSFYNEPKYVEGDSLLERLYESSKNENFTLSILDQMESITI